MNTSHTAILTIMNKNLLRKFIKHTINELMNLSPNSMSIPHLGDTNVESPENNEELGPVPPTLENEPSIMLDPYARYTAI